MSASFTTKQLIGLPTAVLNSRSSSTHDSGASLRRFRIPFVDFTFHESAVTDVSFDWPLARICTEGGDGGGGGGGGGGGHSTGGVLVSQPLARASRSSVLLTVAQH
jgi:hypothetical protein